MLNKIFLEQDGLVVGGNQLVTSGGNVNIANSVFVGANTVTGNLTVTGTFNYPKANTGLPAFNAFGSAFVTAPNLTVVQLMYDKILFDTNNCYNPTNQWMYVNGIYTPPWSWAPNVPGYYQINATCLSGANTTVGAIQQVILNKQNGTYAVANAPLNAGAPTAAINTVVFMNGVSDYVSLFGLQTSGGSLSFGSNAPVYSFNGCFLRPA